MRQAKLTLLYDGSCPICSWEQRNLSRRDRHGRLAFINIQAPNFDPTQYGTTMDALMARLHAVTAEGRVIQGVETLIESYRAVGWWWAYLPLNALPRRLANLGYEWFARHRYAISRRIGHLFGPTCDGDICRRK
jgi:predicted DCC family thiol-disulfide oxidoreductase YuxK